MSAGAPQYTLTGGDWDEVVAAIAARDKADRLEHDRIVINMGPVYPSTHGVLRLVLEIDGERVTEVRVGTGYLPCFANLQGSWDFPKMSLPWIPIVAVPGSTPRSLPIPGKELANVFTVTKIGRAHV